MESAFWQPRGQRSSECVSLRHSIISILSFRVLLHSTIFRKKNSKRCAENCKRSRILRNCNLVTGESLRSICRYCISFCFHFIANSKWHLFFLCAFAILRAAIDTYPNRYKNGENRMEAKDYDKDDNRQTFLSKSETIIQYYTQMCNRCACELILGAVWVCVCVPVGIGAWKTGIHHV